MLIRIRTAQIRSVFRVWTGTNVLMGTGRTKTRAQKKKQLGKQVRKSSSYYLQWIEIWRYDSSHIMKISSRRWWTTNRPTKKPPIYSEEETIWHSRCDVGICRQYSLSWWKYYLQVTNHFSKKESWRTQNHDFKISCLAHVQCWSWTSSSRLETVSEKVSKTSSESGYVGTILD